MGRSLLEAVTQSKQLHLPPFIVTEPPRLTRRLPGPGPCSYHAVTSWSRVKGMGIPLWKAAEVTLIWLLAVLLAVPEALAFDMLEMPYRGNKLRVCLLHPEQSGSFMKVSSATVLSQDCTPRV